MSKLLSLFSFLIVVASLNAQDPCGTLMDEDFKAHYYSKDRSYLETEQGRSATLYVPVQYHIVGRDNGTGYYNLRDLIALHCGLNERFAGVDIQFYFHDFPNYINNSDYFEFTSTWTGNAMMNQYNVLEACNVYIVEDPRGVCGYAFYPGSGPRRGGIVLNKSCSAPGSTTLVHEMGHYFGLPHTFSGWENGNTPSSSQQERVNGSNCATAGDRFCDTPADFISVRWTCPFTGNETDLNGDLYRTVLDGTLYMSYANDGCHTKFSPDQMTEMYQVLQAERPYLLNGPGINPVPIDTTVNVAPVSGFAQLPANYVNLKWRSVPGAESYHVLVTRFLNPNQYNIDTVVTDTSVLLTNLQGSFNYRWKVKPLTRYNACTPYSSETNFSTTSLTVVVNSFMPSCAGEDDGALGLEVYGGTQPYTYTWSNGINQNPQGFLKAGNYQVTVTDAGNQTVVLDVDLDDPMPLTIDVEPIGNGYLRVNATGGVPPYTFQWPDGSTSQDWLATSTGSFNVQVTDENGCMKNKNYAFTPIGEALESFSDIRLYPNPAGEGQNVILEFDGNQGNTAEISVLTLAGQEVWTETFMANNGLTKVNIPTSGWSSGMYLVSIQSGLQREVLRLSFIY